MITKASQCSIRVFMACLYEFDYAGLQGGGVAEFENIYMEYIDLSGIGETKEYDLIRAIHNLKIRMDFISKALTLQYLMISVFGEPVKEWLEDLKRYGHRVQWDKEHPEQLIPQLEMVEIKEKSFKAEYDKNVKELNVLRNKEMKPDSNARVEFIRTLNNLGRAGYKIDKAETTVEEFALMIKDHGEMIAELSKKREKLYE